MSDSLIEQNSFTSSSGSMEMPPYDTAGIDRVFAEKIHGIYVRMIVIAILRYDEKKTSS